MTATADPEIEPAPRRRGMLVPLVIGLVLAVAAGGGGFWAASSGPLAGLLNPAPEAMDSAETPTETYVAVEFVPLDTLTISLGSAAGGRHLIVSAALEVDPVHAVEVATLAPRVLDVLNSYLRVIDVRELGEPASLMTLRAQMLRRVQIVTGQGRVRDLLITQFVVN